MRCLICKNPFRVKTTWANLFMEKNYYLCDECSDKYKVNYSFFTYPFNGVLANVFSIFDTSYDVNPEAFILERSYLFSFIRRKINLNNAIFLTYDSLDKMILDSPRINLLQIFNKEIVILLTYYVKF